MTKFNNPFLPKFDLVVTRHRQLVEWLLREGHIDETTPVVEHAHADQHEAREVYSKLGYEVHAGRRPLRIFDLPDSLDGDDEREHARTGLRIRAHAFADEHNAANVRGKHVLGVLPHHLSCEAASITEVQLDWEVEDRAAMSKGDLDVEAVARAARGLHTYVVQRVEAHHLHSAAASAAWRFVEDQGTSFGAGPGILTYVDRHHLGLKVDVVGSGDEQASAEIIMSRGVWRPMCCGPWLDGLGQEVEDIEPASGWKPGFEAPNGPADPGPATFE